MSASSFYEIASLLAECFSSSSLELIQSVCVTAVGGLTSPVKGPYTEPLYIANEPPDSLQPINSSVDYEDEVEHEESVERAITAGRRAKELDDEEEEKEADSNESKRGSQCYPQMLIYEPNHKRSNKETTVPELELRKLARGEVSFTPLLLVSSLGCVCVCVNPAHCFPASLQIST